MIYDSFGYSNGRTNGITPRVKEEMTESSQYIIVTCNVTVTSS